jgi:hypothetical protein
VRLGIHRPQYGRGAGPDAIRRAARRAEELGAAPWRSDIDAWLRSMEELAAIVGIRPG